MALNCDVQALVDQAKCLQCIPPGMEMSVLIAALCQISSTGGGGSGTVTSFSSGGLSPLFTASVATPTTTPALTFAAVNQSPNLFYAGPSSGAAAAPTFRAMVNADLGTGLTPQFARLGLGAAADATILFKATAASGGAGVNVIVGQFEVPTSNPYLVIGTAGANTAGYVAFDRTTARFYLGVYGAVAFYCDTSGNMVGPANIDAQTFSCNGAAGFNGTFDGTNTVTVSHGIVTGIA